MGVIPFDTFDPMANGDFVVFKTTSIADKPLFLAYSEQTSVRPWWWSTHRPFAKVFESVESIQKALQGFDVGKYDILYIK